MDGPRALLDYHIHPRFAEGIDPTWHRDFSPIDIARMRALPNIGYIIAVGSDLGGVFAFQTEEVSRQLPFPLPLVPYGLALFDIFIKHAFKERDIFMEKHGIKHPRDITRIQFDEIAFNSADRFRVSKGGRYLNSLGYENYLWTPSTDLSDNPKEITLQRV